MCMSKHCNVTLVRCLMFNLIRDLIQPWVRNHGLKESDGRLTLKEVEILNEVF